MIYVSSFSVNSIKGWVKKIFPDLRKTQSLNLSLGVLGIVKSRSGLMSEIVRTVPGSKQHKHRLKRFWRFLSNPRVKTGNLQLLWCKWVVNTFVPGRHVTVALDWTELPGNIQLLMAAVPYAGRAIPLLWVNTTYRAFKDSQNRIEERLITTLTKIIPQDKRIILVADRGFGRASLVNFLINLNILFCLRVKADVIIQIKVGNNGKGKKINLRKLKIKVNQVKWFGNISYRVDGCVEKVNLAITLAPPKVGEKEDPWILVTNLRKAKTAISNYKLRFDIEEWFKDLKHQLGVGKLQTKNLDRVRKMILIGVAAYGLLMLIGTVADKLSTIRDQLITGGRKTTSRIWFALRLIHYQMLPGLYWQKVWLKAKAQGP